MRLICPHCMSGVTVPDDAAGKEAVCTNCGKSFPTPPRHSASVVPDPAPPVAGSIEPARTTPLPEPPTPAAPPGYREPTTPPKSSSDGSGFLPTAPAEAASTAGYTKSRGVTFYPNVVAWLPVAFLTLALALTFFPWTGIYVGGAAVYSQGPWSAMVRATNPNHALAAVAKEAIPVVIVWQDKVRVTSDWLLMVPFLLCLILAFMLAWLDRVVGTRSPGVLPPPIARIWPSRYAIIAGLTVLALSFLVIQSIRGFGLERAVWQSVREEFRPAREAAQGNEWKLAVVEYHEGEALKRYNLARTYWMHAGVACTALAALFAIGAILLERRGNKPPPKLLMHY
jgi:hypothetical protein